MTWNTEQCTWGELGNTLNKIVSDKGEVTHIIPLDRRDNNDCLVVYTKGK